MAKSPRSGQSSGKPAKGAQPSAPPGPPLAHERLTDEQVTAALTGVPEWSHVGEAIQRTFILKNFLESMAFVNKAAAAAEAAQHHPDMLIRYNKVTMTLSTHDAGGITKKDFDLAAAIDRMVV